MPSTIRAKILGAILVTAILVTAGCGAGDSSKSTKNGEKHVTIGVTVYDLSSFISEGKVGMEAYAKTNNITLDFLSANNDVSTQASQMEQLIHAKVAAIIIVPVQANSLQPQIAQAKAAKIPVLAVNTTLSSNNGLAATVLPDDVKAGEQEMQMMADKLGGKGNIVILQGPLGSSPELNRTKGIENVLAKYPNIHVLAKDTAIWQRPPAVTKMANWISSFGSQVNGLVSENDDMGLGASQAMKQANVTFPIVGIDGIEDGLNAVKTGTFIGTSLQDGLVEMPTGLAVADQLANGKKLDKTNYTYVMPPVTKANVGASLQHIVTNQNAFVATLPKLIAANLKSGDIANETLTSK